MKKAAALLLALSMLLGGCSPKSDDTTTPPTPTQPEAPTTAAPTTEPPTTAPPVTEPPVTVPNTIFDYSHHDYPDEDMYETILSDPGLLALGKRVVSTIVPVADWSRRTFEGFTKTDIFGYDVRGLDISNEDLSVVTNFNDLSYSTTTVWPDSLPQGFDPAALIEANKNPGLGIRDLHAKGIDGTGVGIAIIDQSLLLDHEQYRDNLMYYEQIHCSYYEASLHGAAVASIAVGKDIGVAPGSKLYYIAETHTHNSDTGGEDFDASIIADSVLRVLEINRHLADDEKIRVISISRGYSVGDKGFDELNEAIKQAESQNIFVITTSPRHCFDFPFFGANREYTADPDDPASFIPASWVTDEIFNYPSTYKKQLLFPMGSRTIAGCTGTDVYDLSYEGGLSWAVPWCAGFYALCCQVDPDITPQEFIQLLKDTSTPVETTYYNKPYTFGNLVNPAAIIEKLPLAR